MTRTKTFNILIIMFLFSINLYSQPTDSILNFDELKADTAIHPAKIYKTLRETAAKTKWTKQLYYFIFKTPSPLIPKKEGPIDLEFRPFEGKRVRKITVKILPPFGSTIESDSIKDNWFDRAGNNLHVLTKNYIVHDNLLFKEGDLVNSDIFAESEALLRNTGYISDARIHLHSIPGTNDVDVKVIIRDVWSIGFHFKKLTTHSTDFELYDRNFLGIGSNFSLRGIYNNELYGNMGYGASYVYRNFLGSFIDLKTQYLNDISSYNVVLSAEKPLHLNKQFFGQTGYTYKKNRKEVRAWDSITPTHINEVSFSIGHATKPNKKGRRMAAAFRFINNEPSYRDVISTEPPNYAFIKSRQYILKFSLFKQRYYREYMIQNYTSTENIAYGYNVSTQLGYDRWHDYTSGFYSSFSISGGKRFNFGNVFSEGVISSHFNKSGAYQGLFKLKIDYFTPLLYHIGSNRWRQFITIEYSKILNPYKDFSSYLYFNDYVFHREARGKEKLVINSETDVFTRINLAGFRFLFFSHIDIGWIKRESQLFQPENFYWGLGLGVRIRNDLLVFRTLIFKIGWYPRLDSFNFHTTTSDPRPSINFTPSYPNIIPLY